MYDEEVVMAKVRGPEKLVRADGEVGVEKNFQGISEE